jgi:hypothetical protein
MKTSSHIESGSLLSWFFLAAFSATVWWAYDGDTCLEQCSTQAEMSLAANVKDRSSIDMKLAATPELTGLARH